MAKISFPYDKSFYGPWLLDYEQLQKLDHIIDGQLDKAQSSINLSKDEFDGQPPDNSLLSPNDHKKTIQSSAIKKELKVSFRGDKTVAVENFKEIAMSIDFKNETPKNFTYKIELGDVEAEITNDLWSENKIRVRINSLIKKEAQDLLFELERWMKEVNSPIYVRIWRKYGRWVLLLLFAILTFFPNSEKVSQNMLYSEAHKMLDKGVGEKDIARGVEILLALETKYEKQESQGSNKPGWDFKMIMFTGLCVGGLIIVGFPPDSILGICKNEKKLIRWRRWVKVVTFIIPTMIIIPFLINLISNKLG